MILTFNFQFPNDQQAICKTAGLAPLSLDSAEEFEYFLALLRFISIEDFVGIGGRQDANLWYWQSSNVRINYPMQWLQNFPHHDTERNCLYINMHGFANFHYNARGINSTVFCQKIEHKKKILFA